MSGGISVSVRHSGACGKTCTSNSECGEVQYCARDLGACGDQGLCVDRPEHCEMVWEPVCSCTNKTYVNACLAAYDGLNVAKAGECLGAAD